MANYISLIDLANQLNLSKNTIIERFKKLEIEPLNLNHKLYYLKSNVDLLGTMKNPRNFITPNERFAIVEYFLTHRNNTALDLQKVFFIPQRRIDRIITEYLNNGFCVIAPSKLNKE
jgi:transcriptional antiterminator